MWLEEATFSFWDPSLCSVATDFLSWGVLQGLLLDTAIELSLELLVAPFFSFCLSLTFVVICIFISVRYGRLDAEDRRSRHCPYLDTINRSVKQRKVKFLGQKEHCWSEDSIRAGLEEHKSHPENHLGCTQSRVNDIE